MPGAPSLRWAIVPADPLKFTTPGLHVRELRHQRLPLGNLSAMSTTDATAIVHARSRLVRAEAKPKGTLITTEAEIAAEGSDRPALLYKMQVLYTPPR